MFSKQYLIAVARKGLPKAEEGETWLDRWGRWALWVSLQLSP